MLKVLRPGFYSAIQDNGRFGYRDYGVPISGAMDSYSAKFANTLLGNTNDAAVIEMTMIGGKFQFLEPTWIAISGAEMSPKLNGLSIKMNSSVFVNKADILSFGRVESGFRTYLAVKDGFNTDVVMHSRSLYAPITNKGIIGKEDIIEYNPHKYAFRELLASIKYNYSILNKNILEAYKGAEFYALSNEQRRLLLSSDLKVSKLNNRMAYQLESLFDTVSLDSILTSPVLPGTIQLTPSGNLIVLMRDCQTTGGYPRILQLTENAINILSQKTTGSRLKIRLKE